MWEHLPFTDKFKSFLLQGGHDTGKTGNLVINISRQEKRRKFQKLNKKPGLSYDLTGGRGHLENKICSFLLIKTQGKQGISHKVECGHPVLVLLSGAHF